MGPESLRIWNAIHFGQQNRIRSDEGVVKGVFGVDLFNGRGRSFGKFPKRFTVFGSGVKRVSIKELHNVVSKELIEDLSCLFNGVIETVRLTLD